MKTKEAASLMALVTEQGIERGQWVNDLDPKAQYLLLRGVSLLYPNPRGSGGYGRAYERLNDGDWGGGDYDDLVQARQYAGQLRRVVSGSGSVLTHYQRGMSLDMTKRRWVPSITSRRYPPASPPATPGGQEDACDAGSCSSR